MTFNPLIPERLTFAHLADGWRYELWRTPQRGVGFTLYCYHERRGDIGGADVERGGRAHGIRETSGGDDEMKCEIKWIDKDGRPTPDENEAVGYAHSHESIWSMPCGGINNKIVGYNPRVIRQSFPICAAHLAQAPRRLHLENGGGWSFTPLKLTPEDIRAMAEKTSGETSAS